MSSDNAPGVKPPPSEIRSILDEARELVHGDRRADYGTPAENHGRTATLWSAYLGVEITSRQVCILNVLQKVSRDAHAPKRDNLVDIAGYASNADLCPLPGVFGGAGAAVADHAENCNCERCR